MAFRNVAAAIALVLPCSLALAAPFYTSAFGDGVDDVAQEIRDLVTDDFLRAFDAQKYTIVVMFQFDQIDKDSICSATAGVSRRTSDDRNVAIPGWRFASTSLNRNAGSMTYGQKKECLVGSIRRSVKSLMEANPATLRKKSASSL